MWQSGWLDSVRRRFVSVWRRLLAAGDSFHHPPLFNSFNYRIMWAYSIPLYLYFLVITQHTDKLMPICNVWQLGVQLYTVQCIPSSTNHWFVPRSWIKHDVEYFISLVLYYTHYSLCRLATCSTIIHSNKLDNISTRLK